MNPAQATLPAGDSFWEMLSAVGTLAAVVAALVIALIQGRDARSTAARSAALVAYDRYLELAISHPVLANGDLTQITNTGKFGAYEWFFSFMASACEQVLLHTKGSERCAWLATVESQVQYHRDYVLKHHDEIAPHYSLSFRRILARVRDMKGGQV
ncbi:hypothetical protein ACVFYP_18855 [Roseomonas sp. F4]